MTKRSVLVKQLLCGISVVAIAAIALPAVDAAAQGQGQGGQGGKPATAGQGSHGKSDEARGQGGQGLRGILREDVGGDEEDSDRPAWAGGKPELNPHAGAGAGNPTSGTAKGDIYGDIVVMLRDPATGALIPAGTSTDPETGEVVTEYYVCLDAACTTTVPTEFGEIPEGVATIEVDFGRSSVARSPDKVTEQALDEALTKLETATSISLDPAGRIVYTTADGTFTINSPLENLAMYIDLATGLASDSTTQTETLLAAAGLANLDTAASLLAGLADKTGEITLDYLVNENVIAGVVQPGDYYDYSTFTYDRDTAYPGTVTYYLQTGDTLEPRTVDVSTYLDAVNGSVPADVAYASLFATAANDALQVIELVHDQIYTDELPGTVGTGG